MNKRKNQRAAALLSAALTGTILAIGTANAAITWEPAFELVSVSDLDFTGANIKAANGGNDAGVVVGGVTFDNYESPNFGDITSEPSWITSASDGDPLKSFPVAATDLYSPDTGDENLNTILATSTYIDNQTVTYTLSGLTDGQLYQVQIIGQADSRAGTMDRVTLVDGGDAGGGVTIHRYADLDGDTVKHVATAVGTFTAVGTTQTFTAGSPDSAGFSAFILSEIASLDADGDGLKDLWEDLHFGNGDGTPTPAELALQDGTGDPDADGLDNEGEETAQTDPNDPDTDDDGLLDGYETGTGTYVGPTDTGTNPTRDDTDNDGLLDGVENNSGIFVSTSDPGTDPNDPDTDDDGLLDGVENNNDIFTDANMTGTDPHDPDSDGDLEEDGAEVANGTNPNDPDEGGLDGFIAGQQVVDLSQTATDVWAICYIDEARPFRLGGDTSNAIRFSFFAAPASIGGGGRVTPFVAEVIAPNDFIVRAIGTTRIEGVDWSAEGLQTFPFSDDAAPVVRDGWVAGFITSDPDGSNASNTIITYRANAGIDGWLTGGDITIDPLADPGGIEVGLAPEEGTSGTFDDAAGMRDYSFQIVAGTPEVILITNINHDADAGTTELTWTSSEGELFDIRKSLDLAGDPGTWPIVMTQVPAAAAPAETTTLVIDTSATGPKAFYKIFKIPPPPIFDEDFESGAAGWSTLDNGVSGATRWELGTPTVVGPTGAHSPVTCYGTDLDADYTDGLNNGGTGISLRSPLINLNGATSATLVFWHYLDVSGIDEGDVRFLDKTGALIEISADSPYFNMVPPTGWEKVSIQLPAAVIANGEVIVEWEFRSDTDTTDNVPGWYIDDVSIKE